MVFKELVGFFFGGVEVPFRVGEVAVEWIAKDFLEMSETLLVTNDLYVIRSAKVLSSLISSTVKASVGAMSGWHFVLKVCSV